MNQATERSRPATQVAQTSTAALRISTVVYCLLSIAPGAQAHPGHSLHETNTWHLLASPDHLAFLALGGAGLLLASRLVQRRLSRWLIRVVGAIVLFAAARLWQASV